MRLLPNRDDLLQGVAGFVVIFVVGFPAAVFRDVVINESAFADALGFGLRAAGGFGLLGAVIGAGWSWASDDED